MDNQNYKKGRNDVFSGIILCLFAAIYFYLATQIRIMKMLAATFLNASSIPKLWGVLMFVLGVAMILRGVKAIRRERAAGYIPEQIGKIEIAKRWFDANFAAVFMFIVLALYLVLLEPIGFLFSTFFFLWAEFNVLSRKGERKIAFTGLLALICAVGIYVLFRYVFTMPLPQGILKGVF